ncbi:MAG: S49 family peptidase [Rhodospirillales bacterium]|nr:S49 family peptidase [Rhodospirillales bacterium]
MRLRHLLSWLPFERFRNPPPVIAVVPLHGVIGRVGALRQGLSLGTLSPTLERAFTIKDAKAVALVVNSPGGSPVQSALIARRIRALAEEHDRPVFAFAEDVAASGGYWLLAAGDEIWADESSIVGSIGVISAGFGFTEALGRLGIERRVHTAGVHKGALDPFRPEQAEEVAHLRRIQADVHESFRQHVRTRRGDRLKGEESELFSGRYWAGRQALDLGLIDGLGDVRTIMREKFGAKVRLRVIGQTRRWWRRSRLPGIGAEQRPGFADLLDRTFAWVEERLMWNQFGL